MDFSTGFWGVHFHIVFTVKVTGKNKKGKKLSKTLKCAVTVKNPAVTLSQAEVTTAIGESVKLTAKTTPASAGSSVTFTTSDEKVATVANDGTVKAVAAGEATITAAVKCGTKSVTASAKVTVKKTVFKNVTQNKLSELSAEISGETKDLKPADFTVENTETKVKYPVSKVNVDSKDKTKVTLVFFNKFNDGKNYDVTLDGVTKSFKASDGKVASIAIDPVTIPYATETEIKLVSKDAAGVVVDEIAYSSSVNANYEFSLETKSGYISGSKLSLNKVGDTATAKIAYKDGYDETGKVKYVVEPTTVTITAVDQAVVSNFKVRIDKAGKSYAKAADSQRVIYGDDKNFAYFEIKDANDKEISDKVYNSYTVKSSDETVLMLASSRLTDKGVKLTPVKAGSAYILFEDKDGKVVGSVSVTVVAERSVVAMEVDADRIELTNKFAQTKKVNVKLKDQYGEDCTDKFVNDMVVSLENGPKSAIAPTVSGKKTISFVTATNTTPGTYKYKVSYKSLAREISVTVKAPTGIVDGYRMELDKNAVDICVKDGNTDSQIISVNVFGTASGDDASEISSIDYTVKDKDGKIIFGKTGNATSTTGAAFCLDGAASAAASYTTAKTLNIHVVDVNGATATANLGDGTYTVTAKFTVNGSDKELTQQFTVSDKQPKATISGDIKREVNGSTIEDALRNAIAITYDGKEYKDSAIVITDVEATLSSSGKVTSKTAPVSGQSMTVSKLKVSVTVAPGISMSVDVDLSGLTGSIKVN